VDEPKQCSERYVVGRGALLGASLRANGEKKSQFHAVELSKLFMQNVGLYV
jgi:hypothetical protein